MGPQTLKVKIGFHEPSEFFDTSRFKEARIGAAICGKAFRSDGTADGTVIHVLRDTDYGCEMRSRFWLFDAPDMAGMGLMMHCLEEMGHLADILPDLFAKETAGK